MRPDYTDPWAAAHVSEFMQAEERGRWRLKPFEIDEDHYFASRMRVMHEAGDDEFRRVASLERVVPVGSWISLQRKRTEIEAEGDKMIDLVNEGYVPVMSDTPAEIEGHRHAIENATGRVLIHGLGLGCLVSALMAKPDVTQIDVVDVDPDVIHLTGHYYTHDPRVQIFNRDCLHMNWSQDARWDYVWHDIWSHISPRNLEPKTAEHGIAYSTLFDLFEKQAAMQGAWAYEEAVLMREADLQAAEDRREWEEQFWAADLETKVDMVFEDTVRDHIRLPDGRTAYPKGTDVPPQFLQFFEEQQPGLKDHLRTRLTDGSFTRESFEAWRDEDEPIGNPNDEIEENARGSV